VGYLENAELHTAQLFRQAEMWTSCYLHGVSSIAHCLKVELDTLHITGTVLARGDHFLQGKKWASVKPGLWTGPWIVSMPGGSATHACLITCLSG